MINNNITELIGTVEAISFRREENGFTVLELATEDELVTVVGVMADINEGEELKVMGTFINHPSFGPQFKMSTYHVHLPANSSAIRKYLASGALKGIGPVTASRIVDMFGDQTLEVIETTPEKLTVIRGITPKKANEIAEDYKRIHGIRSVMSFLTAYNINPSQSVLIWKRWGLAAIDIIKENPFAICTDYFGIDFSKADFIRENLKIPADSDCRVKGAVYHVLRHNTQNGHTCLPIEKLIQAAITVLNIEMDFDLVKDKILDIIEHEILNENLVSYTLEGRNFIFLPELFTAETYIANRISLMMRSFSDTKLTYEKDIDDIEQSAEISFARLQRDAINTAMSKGLFVLTGGPGTGKTTTLNGIISLYKKYNLKVALAAPTGRAAKRLTEVTGEEAKTIHRLLEVEFSEDGDLRFTHNEKNPLKYDVVIIDEMSMVDVKLFESLLRGIKLSCKLILVGDDDQLPPVGAGYALKSIIDSECVPVIKLKDIFRQAANSLIVTNAHAIVNGEKPNLTQKDNDFFFLRSASYKQTALTVVDLCATRLPKTYGFSPIWDIQVLAPTRLGEIGTFELNLKLQQALNPSHKNKSEINVGAYFLREGDKVMQIKNNYDIIWSKGDEKGTGIFNGDIGIIQSIDKTDRLVMILFEDRVAEYTFEMLNEIELAYAVTVHKSQGSEYDAVIIPLMYNHPKLYYRSLFYTAVTRAKKMVIILGSESTVYNMIANNKKRNRYTCLKDFLITFCGEE